MRHPNLRSILAVAALTVVSALPAVAMPPGIEVDSSGGLTVDGLKAGLQHYDSGWNLTRQGDRTVQADPGYPVASASVFELKGCLRLNQYPPGFQFQEWVREVNTDTVSYSMSLHSPNPVPTNTLCLAFELPVKTFAGRQVLLDGKPRPLGKEVKDTANGESHADRIELLTGNGTLTITGSKLAVRLQDNRQFNVKSFSLRVACRPGYGKISAAKLNVNISFRPLASIPATPGPAAADSALSSPGGLKGNSATFGGIKFQLNPGSKNGGLSNGAAASATVKATDPGRRLYLLHAVRGKLDGAVIEAEFADGSRQTIPADAASVVDFTNPVRHPNAAVVAAGYDRNGNPCGFGLSVFTLDRVPVKLTFRHAGSGRWLIAGASLSPTAVPIAQIDSITHLRAGTDWLPLPPLQPVKAGSALDFSALLDAPAGKYGRIVTTPAGHFAAEKAPGRRFRFFGPNLCFSAQLLEKSEAEALADELARAGYNSVRFHHFDREIGLASAPQSTTLDPEKLDRLDYLFACLKKRGIYITIDLYCSRRLKSGELPGYPDLKGYALKSFTQVYAPARDNWKTYVRHLMTHRNPYTGMTWAEDPALFGVSLLNENTVYGAWDNDQARPLFMAAYQRWLHEHQLDTPANRAARGELFVRFLTDTHIAMFRELSRFLRDEIGYRGLVTDANFRELIVQSLLRNEFDFVDNHTYWDHPHYLPGHKWTFPHIFNQNSVLKAAAIVPRMLAPTRIFGKPFTVTEINYVFPNRFRAEGGPVLGAYAALQDWDGIYHFAWAHNRESVLRRNPINGFDEVNDPITMLAEKIRLLMFIRGDVKPASAALAWPFGPFSYEGNTAANLLHYPNRFELAGLYCRVGSIPDGKKLPGLTVLPRRNWENALPAAVREMVDRNRVYTSQTGEIRFDSAAGSFAVVTPRTESLVLRRGSLSGGLLRVDAADSFQALTAAALDAAPLADSHRILVIHQTDVTNTMIRFSSEAMTAVENWGRAPLLLRRGKAQVSLKLHGQGPWHIAALGLDGSVKGEIPATVRDGSLRFTADTAHAGGTMVYLITPR